MFCIQDVIIKTLIAADPILKHNYRSTFPNHTRGSACFEILGFDVLLDRKLKPWLMEVSKGEREREEGREGGREGGRERHTETEAE